MLLFNCLLVLELNKVTSEKTLAEKRKTNKLLELSHAELKKSSQNMECELKRKTQSISEAESRVEEVENEMERLKEEFRFDIYSTCAFISISLCLLLSLSLSNSVLTGSYLHNVLVFEPSYVLQTPEKGQTVVCSFIPFLYKQIFIQSNQNYRCFVY